MAGLTIDTDDFTRRRDTASGSMTLQQLPRLRSLLESDDGGLRWRLEGDVERSADGSERRILRLKIDGSGSMLCGRCLAPVQVSIDADRLFKLSETEAQAEREDPDEDRYDVLARSRRFDVHELIEDEAIMALPAAPRHPECSMPGHGADEPGGPAVEHPFAPLASLRGRTGRKH